MGISDGMPTIKDNVIVGTGAKVLGGILVQEGVMIGANSVVIHDVISKYVCVVGAPAKPCGDRGEH